MSTMFITGATGFLGSYVLDELLRATDHSFALLTRASNRTEAIDKLWRAMQLHLDADQFRSVLPRIEFVRGDLTAPNIGLSDADQERLSHSMESVLHIAASLNRKSETACLNHNLRGTLGVIRLAQRAHQHHGLRRFSYVSTVAVAGQRDREVVTEDEAIDWMRRDYDPYGRTKKFCEHMVHELLPDVPRTVFRPSIVMGDSRFPETTQFDMVRAFCALVDLPVVPMSGDTRLDIVNADWVGYAIATLHASKQPRHVTYHLSSGVSSPSAAEIAHAIAHDRGRRTPTFVPALERGFGAAVRGVASFPTRNIASRVATLFKVFWPYITYDTVFDHERVVSEIGRAPTRFSEYCAGLYAFSKQVNFRYPHKPWLDGDSIGDPAKTAVASNVQGSSAQASSAQASGTRANSMNRGLRT